MEDSESGQSSTVSITDVSGFYYTSQIWLKENNLFVYLF